MKLIYFIIGVFLIGGLFAQRSITLDTPVQARTGITDFTLNSFSYDVQAQKMVIGFLPVGSGEPVVLTYYGDDFDIAYSFLINPSLENKIITRLQVDGKLGPGLISQ